MPARPFPAALLLLTVQPANMNAARTGVENLDLEKLNDKDKGELRQFLANEQQRSQIQSREFQPPSMPPQRTAAAKGHINETPYCPLTPGESDC